MDPIEREQLAMQNPNLYKRYCKQWQRYLQALSSFEWQYCRGVFQTLQAVKQACKANGYEMERLPGVWPSLSVYIGGVEKFVEVMEAVPVDPSE
jgi:hypothetical protein